ncbi:hypothetical protein C0Q70_02425 [Pomacea canaliculata]|uniref:Major facilitator superfamily (MFS) profile domain-containing protein n=1 Tax=Pomacea canaliculata TaxID=400727 RepID=A0A2T7PPW4_POMCA|nr:hypothetical protein C0Q70_02425 [Pomacea canaliculata]
MLGGVTAGLWANRYGRRGALLRNNSTAVVAAALLGFAKMSKSYEMLIVGRFVSGINAGVNSGVGPLYLAEISPVSLRGLVGTLNQLAITLGVLVAEAIGLSIALGTDELWPLCVGFTIIPVLFQLSTLTCCPETPHHLMLTLNDDDEAEKALVWLRGTEDIGEELEEIRVDKFSVADLFKNAELRWPLIISLMLQLSQQFSGINAVIYYSTSIFEEANLSEAASQYATVGVGLVNVIMTFFSALLMDKLGRRVLMITGLAGLFAFSSVLVTALVFQGSASWLSYVCIVAVVFYIIFFATGPGAIPWFYVAELFAQGPRTAAVSISVLVNWFANFIVGVIFPELESSLGVYSFLPFVVMLLGFLIFTVAFVPETKGKRIEDITLLFKTSASNESSKVDLTYRQISEDVSSSVQSSGR